MKRVLFCLLLWLSCLDVFACANTLKTGTRHDGSIEWSDRSRTMLRLRSALKRILPADGAAMEERLRGATEFQDRNDYAVALMYLGRPKEAITLLQQLEAEKPGQYSVAANLGTAFELSGDNQSALHWIQEGINRNAESHQGTEWLHVRILEAKLAQEKDPDFFKKHSVLDLVPTGIGSTVPIGDKAYAVQDVIKALNYQLRERIQFVKPPDAPVASLLFDYAAIEAATATLETAKSILQLAAEYGYPSDRIDPLIAEYDRRIAWGKTKRFSIYGLAGLAVIAFFIYAFKRRWIVLSRRDLPAVALPPKGS